MDDSSEKSSKQGTCRCLSLAQCFGTKYKRKQNLVAQGKDYSQTSKKNNTTQVSKQQQYLSRESLNEKYSKDQQNKVINQAKVQQYLKEVDQQNQNQFVSGTFSQKSQESKEDSEPQTITQKEQISKDNVQPKNLVFSCFGASKVANETSEAEPDLIGVPYGQIGLVNNGNTCFMNAAVQCLRCTPNFLELLEGQYQNRRLVLLLPDESQQKQKLIESTKQSNEQQLNEKKLHAADQLNKIGDQGALSHQMLNTQQTEDNNELDEDPVSFNFDVPQYKPQIQNMHLQEYLKQQRPINTHNGVVLCNQDQSNRQLLNGGNMQYYNDNLQQNMILSKTLEDKKLPSVQVQNKIFDTQKDSDTQNSNFSDKDQVFGRSLSETAQLMRDCKLEVLKIENLNLDFRQRDICTEIFGKSIIDTHNTAEQMDFNQLVSKTHNTITQLARASVRTQQNDRAQTPRNSIQQQQHPTQDVDVQKNNQDPANSTQQQDLQQQQKYRIDKSITETFIKLIKDINSGDISQTINPDNMFKRLSKHPLGQELCDGGQHDSQEFFNILLNCIHVELKKGDPSKKEKKVEDKEPQTKDSVCTSNKLISQSHQLINSGRFQFNTDLPKASMKDIQDDLLDFIHNSAKSVSRTHSNVTESQRIKESLRLKKYELLGEINKSSQRIMQLGLSDSLLSEKQEQDTFNNQETSKKQKSEQNKEASKEQDIFKSHQMQQEGMTPQQNDNNQVADQQSKNSSQENWEKYLRQENSLITELFSGQFESTIVCHKCSTKTIRHEIFQELMIPIQRLKILVANNVAQTCDLKNLSTSFKEEKKGGWLLYKHSITLEEMVKVFTQGEEMKDNEAYFCDKCKSKQTATKKIQISRFPKVLVIQLLRSKEKLHHLVKFPLVDLDMTQFSSQYQNLYPESQVPIQQSLSGKEVQRQSSLVQKIHQTPNQSSNSRSRNNSLSRSTSKKDGDNESVANSSIPQEATVHVDDSKYNLYGVINHFGSMQQGHYTSYCKIKKSQQKEEWFLFNDSLVSRQSPDRIVTSNAYMLFYVSKDFISSLQQRDKS